MQGGRGRTYIGTWGADRWLEWVGERSKEKNGWRTGRENMTDEWVSESDIVFEDEVSDAHSCKCKASSSRMFDKDDVKDHSLNVQELKRASEMYIMGCLQRIGDGETQKDERKRTRLDLNTAAVYRSSGLPLLRVHSRWLDLAW